MLRCWAVKCGSTHHSFLAASSPGLCLLRGHDYLLCLRASVGVTAACGCARARARADDVRLAPRAFSAFTVYQLYFDTRDQHRVDMALRLNGTGDYVSLPDVLVGGSTITLQVHSPSVRCLCVYCCRGYPWRGWGVDTGIARPWCVLHAAAEPACGCLSVQSRPVLCPPARACEGECGTG